MNSDDGRRWPRRLAAVGAACAGLLVLAAVFAVVVVALGRWRGLAALVGIAVSLGVLLAFVFPALLEGAPPLGVALSGAAVIAYATLYLAHGVNDRTTVALVGTLASLGLTAGLAVSFARPAALAAPGFVAARTAASPAASLKSLALPAIIQCSAVG